MESLTVTAYSLWGSARLPSMFNLEQAMLPSVRYIANKNNKHNSDELAN
jgi:hypothetical protein